jgi:hypothetical protein
MAKTKTIHILWHEEIVDGMDAVRVLRFLGVNRLEEDVFLMSDYCSQESFALEIIQWHERSEAFEEIEIEFWKINPVTFDLEYAHAPEYVAFVDQCDDDLESMPEWKPKEKPKVKAKRKAKSVA